MGVGAVLEPAVVVGLLFGGTYLNRNTSYKFTWRARARPASWDSDDPLLSNRSSSETNPLSLLSDNVDPKWRTRELQLFGFRRNVASPNSRQFKDRWFSRVIKKFPFLQEAFYWALIYWVYQIGRAVTAVTIVEGTVHVARKHALQLIHLEESLHIFWEVGIQRFFLQYPTLMVWINRTYSFIHIPGTILFLVYLYYYTNLKVNNAGELEWSKEAREESRRPSREESLAGPRLYEARRRTMATCNLIAFVVFTLWPCMPPRLLSDKLVEGPEGAVARSYGFVDTVHGDGGEGSVWTQNKFCNQYAAMPSLHFGYSLLIGLTILTIPLPQHQQKSKSLSIFGSRIHVPVPNLRRSACIIAGTLYPLIILIAIVATANHFILDAVAGALVCGLAWNYNHVLLNLLPLEDWFLCAIRVHFPERAGYDSE
ncbi:integral membrane protein [Tothia fuscella]|uniref:Integral membrane protein n=1 Tax=Tothia fuscella TaxID=1048955 RepID=A0A9P4NZB4_9PEZI|nr:integral membrane protein [Tothia fuscella]